MMKAEGRGLHAFPANVVHADPSQSCGDPEDMLMTQLGRIILTEIVSQLVSSDEN